MQQLRRWVQRPQRLQAPPQAPEPLPDVDAGMVLHRARSRVQVLLARSSPEDHSFQSSVNMSARAHTLHLQWRCGVAALLHQNVQAVSPVDLIKVVLRAGGGATGSAAAPAGAGHAAGRCARHARPRCRVLRARHGALPPRA